MRKYKEIPRKNGFERPFNCLQVLSWILFCCNIFVYYLIITPIFPLTAQVVDVFTKKNWKA